MHPVDDEVQRSAAEGRSTVDVRDPGEAAALRHLHLIHRPVLVAYAVGLANGDIHWAEDIVQETLLRAWRNPGARNEDGRWNRAWLFTVARRVAIDNVRAARVRPVEYTDEVLEVAYDHTEERILRDLDSRTVRDAVAALPERLRTTLITLYFEEHSIAEAAASLNIPPGTVKSRSFHAIRALRKSLAERGFFTGTYPERSTK
ncbi:sigma-70 family RNA polymerase sigma factor [Actinoplanes sp. NPDC051494]|uniref:sigma-70 family RNA polymerase sigma factor n=1 Tax=Actinoplanes sp. NPDC051494 TaxID=3363907 RepID=UPI003796DB51